MLSWKIPSKTFLCGEYAALRGGPSLLLVTEPFFSVTVSENQNNKCSSPFHPDSPAGKWFSQTVESAAEFSFEDPHGGRGGFGASTAEFLSVYLYTKKKIEKEISISSLLQDYRQVSQVNGALPSGADVVAQFLGAFDLSLSDQVRREEKRLVYFDARSQSLHHSVYHWPFSEVELLVLRTGKKLATHDHLQNLDLGDVGSLSETSQSIHQALESKSLSDFLSGIEQYGELLQQRGWVAEHTQEFLQKISREEGVLAAKGCGAMGADTIFVCVQKRDKDRLLKSFSNMGLSQ